MSTKSGSPVPGATNYRLYCYDYDLPGYLLYGDSTATLSTSVSVTSGHDYFFRVMADNSAGEEIGSTNVYKYTSTGGTSRYTAFVFSGQ